MHRRGLPAYAWGMEEMQDGLPLSAGVGSPFKAAGHVGNGNWGCIACYSARKPRLAHPFLAVLIHLALENSGIENHNLRFGSGRSKGRVQSSARTRKSTQAGLRQTQKLELWRQSQFWTFIEQARGKNFTSCGSEMEIFVEPISLGSRSRQRTQSLFIGFENVSPLNFQIWLVCFCLYLNKIQRNGLLIASCNWISPC